MSVIFYSAQELGNVAAVAVEDHRDLDHILKSLRVLSVANASAYNATYTDDPQKAVATRDIKAEYHQRADQPNVREAIRTAAGLDYNMVSNAGTDFGAEEYVRSRQILILNCVLRRVGDLLPDPSPLANWR